MLLLLTSCTVTSKLGCGISLQPRATMEGMTIVTISNRGATELLQVWDLVSQELHGRDELSLLEIFSDEFHAV